MSAGVVSAVVLAGSVGGTLVFLSMLRWVMLVVAAHEQASLTEVPGAVSRKVALLVLCQSFFHSAPWLILATAYFLYHVYSERWAV
jgi:hypothetical protein